MKANIVDSSKDGHWKEDLLPILVQLKGGSNQTVVLVTSVEGDYFTGVLISTDEKLKKQSQTIKHSVLSTYLIEHFWRFTGQVTLENE